MWAAHAGAESLPPLNSMGARGEAMDSCRKSVPIPYELVAPLILAQDNGILTWQGIWSDHIAPVVLGDAQKVCLLLHLH